MNKVACIGQVAMLTLATALVGCTNVPLYGDGGAGRVPASSSYPASQNYAQWGTVMRVELVPGERASGTLGTIAGGVVGGLAGNQVGGGTGRTIATVAGAVGGALIGRTVEQNTRQPGQDHYRVTVRLEDGGTRAFDYAEAPNVREGERVRVEGDQVYR